MNWAGKGLYGWRWAAPSPKSSSKQSLPAVFIQHPENLDNIQLVIVIMSFMSFMNTYVKKIFVDAGCRAFQMWAQRSQDLYFK